MTAPIFVALSLMQRFHLAHRTFRDVAELDAAIRAAVIELNQERRVADSCDKP